MSASFSTSFKSILQHDIRHIHSGLPLSDVRFKKNLDHGKTVNYDKVLFDLKLNKGNTGKLRKKEREFVEEYNIAIPKAPAFKQVSPEHVTRIVCRLHDDSVTEQKWRRKKAERERDRGLEREAVDDKYRRLPEDSERIGDRLHRHPTHCSSTRLRVAVKTPLAP